MAVVLDYSFSHPSPNRIVEYGAVGVVRYLGWDFGSGPRCISPVEYAALKEAGLGVALVWETNAAMVLGGASAGARDGAEARRLCDLLGHNVPIYVAYDFDIQPGQFGLADAYDSAFAQHQALEDYGKYDVIERRGTGWQCIAWSGFGSGSGGSLQGRRVSDKARMFQKLGYVVDNMCDENEVMRPNWLQHNGAGGGTVPVQDVAHQDPHVLIGTVNEVQIGITLICLHNNDPELSIPAVTGQWDSATESAVRAFQRKTGLAVDGIVGINTITALRTLVYLIAAERAQASTDNGQPVPIPVPQDPSTPPDGWYPPAHPAFPGRLLKWQEPDLITGEDVRQFQAQMNERDPNLAAIGYVIDGVYDEQDYNVVLQFQEEAGLEADGIVGPATWDAAFERPTS